MKKLILILIAILVIIVICNLPPFRLIFGGYDCQYSNSDGSFTYTEMHFKGSDFLRCKKKFIDFKKEKLGDTILYRISPMNILHFWDYGPYLFSEKYRVPYKPWEEIEAKRKPLVNKSGFQDF